MKVLFITSTFPRSDSDTQVPWLSHLILELCKRGIAPLVFAPSYKGLPSHTYRGIPVVRFRYAPAPLEILTHEEGAVFKLRQRPWLSVLSIFYLCAGLMGLIRLRKKQFDIVHVQWPFPNGILGLFAKLVFGAKLILTFHGAEFTLIRKVPLGNSILRYILSKADQVIANSTFTRDLIHQILRIPVYIIPFASTVSVGQRATFKRILSKKTFNILFVGRLIERKGVQYLIWAFERLHKKNSNVRLDVVGNGPLLTQIKEQVDACGLHGVVRLYENIGEKELVRFYQKSDLFVLPSIVDRWKDTEGLGVVLIEAMSFGIPVIASNVGGIPSVVKHYENGLLVPQKDPVALANAIDELIRNPNLAKRLGENGVSFVRKNYNWESIVGKTIRLYNNPYDNITGSYGKRRRAT
ncbi:hypothetical protein A2875_02540 [Candidatus Gottesmanbacteria bacterium RIFCSPHIGHO2_01_FULL_46_14]|uniref:Glycosyltransferase subfamily 4-like N-terminal domain-containing protein n=3 Tax=Microgenomates group TaxID=1794810 RepID=A0A1F5ZMW5_9BACT|nr:MAG: Glycosyl transferase group 1 [Candidatus Curtissbacteria bacterium GW2011_GWA1_41_11]OGG13778.1 MAG: hypothetical protein A2875_02540 [Candidatus Gottesmanbacteria bacterium RIFCSPHIGHO2_01_FULL_46_14]OGG28628.1 MAG: hypothetical protein A2971_04815 [Candidatus Gottesmanbacteria bacterium RIFCSPLOWO2_01_FULL_46_21]